MKTKIALNQINYGRLIGNGVMILVVSPILFGMWYGLNNMSKLKFPPLEIPESISYDTTFTNYKKINYSAINTELLTNDTTIIYIDRSIPDFEIEKIIIDRNGINWNATEGYHAKKETLSKNYRSPY